VHVNVNGAEEFGEFRRANPTDGQPAFPANLGNFFEFEFKWRVEGNGILAKKKNFFK
jgi:hypothetical protein